MKQLIKSILAISAALFMGAACESVVDIPPSDLLSAEVIWSGDEAILDQYVIGLYGAVREKSTLKMLSTQATDCLTDIMKDGDYIADRRFNRINYNYQPFTNDDAGILSNWTDSYIRIRRFNEFLRDAEFYKNRFSPDYLKVRVAEVRFMRAMQYFYMIRVYGGVIIRDKIEGPEGNDRPRSTEDECWDYMIKEIKTAVKDLPTEWDASNFSRMTKAAAWGFLSRAALYRAWALKLDGGNPADVKAQFEEVVSAADSCKAAGAALATTYAEVFNNQKSAENLITCGFITGKLSHNGDICFRPKGDATTHAASLGYPIMPTGDLADRFEMADGTKFSWDDYNANPAAWGNDPFSGREPRFYTTIMYNNMDWEGRKIEAWVGGEDGFQEFVVGVNVTGTCTGYYFRKFITEGDDSWPSSGGGTHFDVMLRYGEVVLNKAEALAQAGNIPAAVIELNRIRSRVNLPGRNATTIDDFMALLEQERIVELAGENFRYWDLRRWRKGRDVLHNSTHYGVKITKDAGEPGGFKYEKCDIDGGMKFYFMDKYYHFSLPQSELNNNLALNHVNNPSW